LSAATLRSLLLRGVGLPFLPRKCNRSAVDWETESDLHGTVAKLSVNPMLNRAERKFSSRVQFEPQWPR
jgi:hypothetical protein